MAGGRFKGQSGLELGSVGFKLLQARGKWATLLNHR